MQFDLFDQGSESQPGNRQTDLEMLIEEKAMNHKAMNHYERKQEARRERLLAAAERAEAQSEAAYKRADMREEVSGIPFGQPILVGHHSDAPPPPYTAQTITNKHGKNVLRLRFENFEELERFFMEQTITNKHGKNVLRLRFENFEELERFFMDELIGSDAMKGSASKVIGTTLLIWDRN